ncbi:MAG: TIGR03905 family TSCPD domain-containing protein [Clostridia bacterium]|nr:TIGR03905 family TSCPD domain-containing protein [Clostridia bacterium]
MQYHYRTKGTCSSAIDFELEGNVIKNVRYTGGCHGNLQAVSRLAEGMTVEEFEARCKGIRCGFKPTSCADQLAVALRQAYDESK